MIEDLKNVQTSGTGTDLLKDTTANLPYHTHDGINSPKVTAPREMYVPAEAMAPTNSGGCADLAQQSDTAVDMWVLAFDATSEESAFFSVMMPEIWNGKLISARFLWRSGSGSGGVVWGIKCHGYNDDDAVSQTYGTEVLVTDTLATANDIQITNKTTQIVPNGNGNFLQFRVTRKVSESGDTLGVDALLIGVSIIYGVM